MMRSLQCGHGEFAVENKGWVHVTVRDYEGFNAATANSPWRTEVTDLDAIKTT